MKHIMQQVIEYFGGRNKLCGLLDVSNAAMSQWLAEESFPPMRAIQVEMLSNGRFKAVDLVDHKKQGCGK